MKLKIFRLFQDNYITLGLKYQGEKIEKHHLKFIKDLYKCETDVGEITRPSRFTKFIYYTDYVNYFEKVVQEISNNLSEKHDSDSFRVRNSSEMEENLKFFISHIDNVFKKYSIPELVYIVTSFAYYVQKTIQVVSSELYGPIVKKENEVSEKLNQFKKYLKTNVKKIISKLNAELKLFGFQYVLLIDEEYIQADSKELKDFISLWKQLPKNIRREEYFYNLFFRDIYNINIEELYQEQESQSNMLYQFIKKDISNALLESLLLKSVKNAKKSDIQYFIKHSKMFENSIEVYRCTEEDLKKVRILLNILRESYINGKLNAQILTEARNKVQDQILFVISSLMYLENKLPFIMFFFRSEYYFEDTSLPHVKQILHKYKNIEKFVNLLKEKIEAEKPVIFTNLGKRRKLIDGMASEFSYLNNDLLKKYSKIPVSLYDFKTELITDPQEYKTTDMLKLLLVIWYNKKTSLLFYNESEQEFVKNLINEPRIFKTESYAHTNRIAKCRKNSISSLVKTIEKLKIEKLEKMVRNSQDPEIQKWVKLLLKE